MKTFADPWGTFAKSLAVPKAFLSKVCGRMGLRQGYRFQPCPFIDGRSIPMSDWYWKSFCLFQLANNFTAIVCPSRISLDRNWAMDFFKSLSLLVSRPLFLECGRFTTDIQTQLSEAGRRSFVTFSFFFFYISKSSKNPKSLILLPCPLVRLS